MASQLILSPTTKAAVDHLVSRIQEIRKGGDLIPVTILLPSASVIDDMRTWLGDTIGVQMYQFYHLGDAVLDEAGSPIHLIDDAAIRRLIRLIVQEMHVEGLLTTFAPVREKRGFIEVLLNWIREMKSQGIFPEEYAEFAEERETERDRQLAEIYMRYQAFMLANDYSDPDGLLWVAEEILEENPSFFRRSGPLFVLGFDQFTPVQIRILRHLADRFSELAMYLLWDENRSDESLVLSRLRRARDALLANIPLTEQLLSEGEIPKNGLAYLVQNIFETGDPLPVNEQSVRWIEAPDRESEVRWTLREIKKLLFEGVSPSDIAILVPNKHAYLPIVQAVSAEYGVPAEYERPLMSNPAVAAFANLLELPPDYTWRRTFEALRSPYVRQCWLSDEQIELLDQLSRERPVIAGRDQWEFAVRPLAMDVQDSEDEDLGPPPLVATLEPDILAMIEEGLTAFFDHISPPAAATYSDYTWWLQTAILGCFPEEEREGDDAPESRPTIDLMGASRDGPFKQRDMEALGLVMQALRRLLESVEVVPDETEIAWEKYRNDLFALLNGAMVPPDPFQPGVRFARLEEGRARTIDYLFVLGLSEGEFPTPPQADPLYTIDERENNPLPLIRYTPADDTSLWWQVISNVNRQVFLLRPYIDENGAPWQSSPYWDAVRSCFSDSQVERIPIAEHPLPEDAASQNELLVALAKTGARTIPPSFNGQWSYVQLAARIMNQRQSYLPPGEFEGIIRDDSIRNELVQWFGEQHVWSASRLNRYTNCPYSFFAEYVLKLQARPDPEEGLDAMQRGSLLHAILEHLYKQLAAGALAPTTENQDSILEYLEESCSATFPSAPQRYGFRPGALWKHEQQELRRLLRALVEWECEENPDQARFLPYLLEAGFGIGRGPHPPVDIRGDHACFRLAGLIDRIDIDADGRLRVIDYKSGSTAYSGNDLKNGLALQTALYALAAERYWAGGKGSVAESHYWHIPSRKASGSLKIDGFVRDHEVAEEAIQQASWSVAQVRAGVFPSAPAKPIQGGMRCSVRCDFSPICRVTRQSIAKARRGATT